MGSFRQRPIAGWHFSSPESGSSASLREDKESHIQAHNSHTGSEKDQKLQVEGKRDTLSRGNNKKNNKELLPEIIESEDRQITFFKELKEKKRNQQPISRIQPGILYPGKILLKVKAK